MSDSIDNCLVHRDRRVLWLLCNSSIRTPNTIRLEEARLLQECSYITDLLGYRSGKAPIKGGQAAGLELFNGNLEPKYSNSSGGEHALRVRSKEKKAGIIK